MLRLRFVLLQLATGKRDAVETTREEFEDNLFYIIKNWNQKTNNDVFFLSFDNASIQATADITHVRNPNDPSETYPINGAGYKLPLPAYSHDLNRPIEHIFGTVKHLIRCKLYEDWGQYRDARRLQTLVYQLFNNLPVYGLKDHVKDDVAGLPTLWQILSTPQGVAFFDAKGRAHVGSGGNYPNAYAR